MTPWAKRIELALRYYVAFWALTYGYFKFNARQFGKVADKEIESILPLDGFELTWIFFGYSSMYIAIIGVFQVLGALFLIFGRTRLLGAFILIPVMFNIVLIDILYEIPVGATLNAVVYLTCLVGILALNWRKISATLEILTARQNPRLITLDNGPEYFLYAVGGCVVLVLLRAFLGLVY